MNRQSISNLNFLKVLDKDTNKTYYGCDQDWFKTKWQRQSGCGPSAACNIMSYLHYKHSIYSEDKNVNIKKSSQFLMEQIWEYVTPTKSGIPSTKMFYEDVLSYAKSKGLNVKYFVCDIPKEKSLRPKLLEVLKFIEGALIQDVPVAFLNLCNGDESRLESWHWVTIILIEYADDGSSAFVNILDEGLIKQIDITLWYNTTKLGGGFVYFT